MIWLSLGRWDARWGRYLVAERLYRRRRSWSPFEHTYRWPYRWTPFVRVRLRRRGEEEGPF